MWNVECGFWLSKVAPIADCELGIENPFRGNAESQVKKFSFRMPNSEMERGVTDF